MRVEREWLQADGLYHCPFCNKGYGIFGISTHIIRNHSDQTWNPNRGYKNGRVIWNKGKTKQNDRNVRRIAKKLSKTVKEHTKNGLNPLSKYNKTERARRTTSIRQTLKNTGGKSKWYEVNGQKVQGTWERDLAVLMTTLGISWYKPKVSKDVFEYQIDGKTKRYTPDFYLPKIDLYFEVKGFWWGRDKEKMKAVLQQNKQLKRKIIILFGQSFWDVMKAKTNEEFQGCLTDVVKVLD